MTTLQGDRQTGDALQCHVEVDDMSVKTTIPGPSAIVMIGLAVRLFLCLRSRRFGLTS